MKTAEELVDELLTEVLMLFCKPLHSEGAYRSKKDIKAFILLMRLKKAIEVERKNRIP